MVQGHQDCVCRRRRWSQSVPLGTKSSLARIFGGAGQTAAPKTWFRSISRIQELKIPPFYYDGTYTHNKMRFTLAHSHTDIHINTNKNVCMNSCKHAHKHAYEHIAHADIHSYSTAYMATTKKKRIRADTHQQLRKSTNHHRKKNIIGKRNKSSYL